MDKNKLIINKIPLKEFIDILINLYDNNVDFIDLVGSNDSDTQDSLHIGVRPDYVVKDEEDESNNEQGNQNPAFLSKEDFEKLI